MMFAHALYTGTVPWPTSAGSLFAVVARASPAGRTGESDLPRTGTLPFVSSRGAMAHRNVDSVGGAAAGYGAAIPCGPYHAGEEVS